MCEKPLLSFKRNVTLISKIENKKLICKVAQNKPNTSSRAAGEKYIK